MNNNHNINNRLLNTMFELNYQNRLRSLRGFTAWEASQSEKVHQTNMSDKKNQKKLKNN